MQTGELDTNLPWMTKEIINAMCYRDKIVKDHDMDSLFQLTDNADFSIALHEILNNQCDYNPDTLNFVQRVLFLCMHIENAGQADHILSFLQEEFPNYADETVKALYEIGAEKSAEIIKKAIELLPKNGTWFFKIADENSQNLMGKLDREFSNYPDGSMRDLYRKYAEKHRSDLCVGLNL